MQSHQIICGNSFRNLADDYLDEDKQFIDLRSKPQTIFVKTDYIDAFKNKVLPAIDYNFQIITHNSDYPVPLDRKAMDLLEDSRLLKWFGMNTDAIHKKLQPIPIGIANEKWPHGNKRELIEATSSNIDKTDLVYSNYSIETNPNQRNRTTVILQSKNFITIDKNRYPFLQYLKTLKKFKYVICPAGNSIDCHRFWEALYMGVVPIIEAHIAMEFFYDLPVLVVNTFEDLTEELLQISYSNIIKRSNKKMLLSFYKDIICTKSN